MKRPPIIGLAGPARSGKDTIADFLVASVGGYRYAFADPLRAMMHAGFGIDMHDPYWQEHKETPIPAFGVSPRQMMQSLGTDWGRQHVHEDVWLLLAKQQLNFRGAGMIISDVRFENEAAWVRKMGGKLLHVRRTVAPEVRAHVSENGVGVHYQRTLGRTGDFQGRHVVLDDDIIHNDGTLEELQAALIRLTNDLGWSRG